MGSERNSFMAFEPSRAAPNLPGLTAQQPVVLSVSCFSPDGRRIVTASDGTGKVSEVESGRLLDTLAGHRGRVTSASFSRYGQRVVTASDDGTARVWALLPIRRWSSW